MLRKLRIFVAAALLVPALFSNANAFTTENAGALNPTHPPTAYCYIFWNGMWIYYQC